MIHQDVFEDGGAEQSGEAARWNEVLAVWEQVRDLYGLSDDHVQPVVDWVEGAWYDPDPDHAANVHRWNLLVTGAGRVQEATAQAMRAYRIAAEYRDTGNLGWDEIPGWITWIGQQGGFVTVTVDPNTALSGGHGTGTFWRAQGARTGTVYTGTVPDSAHGRNDSALNGQRGSVATVIDLHDTEIEEAIASIQWPAV